MNRQVKETDGGKESAPAVPFADLTFAGQSLAGEIEAAVARVVSSRWFILGPEVEALEREFAAAMGVSHAVGVASGTDAISLILMALSVGPGDEVITSPMTAAFTALAVSRTGALPVFADVDPATLNLSPASVEERLGAKTKAILPVHLYGNPCALSELQELAEAEGAFLVEDACQAHGARYRGNPVGSFGQAGAVSFYPTKNLGALGDGGMVLTEDEEMAEKVRRLRNGGQTSRYRHEVVGMNSRLDEIQAAILRAKLPRLGEWNRRRGVLVECYREGLASTPVAPIGTNPDGESVHHLMVVRAPERDELRSFLDERGVTSLIHYPVPVHLQPAYAFLGDGVGSFPEAERAAGEIVSLPLFPSMSDGQLSRVVEAVADFYR